MERIELADFLLIAERQTGVAAGVLARDPQLVETAGRAIGAPFSGFGDVELFPDLAAKAAVYASRIVRYHPLMDGNKRTAFVTMIEFIERNGSRWTQPSGGQAEQAEVIERLAAGTLSEEDFIEWVRARIATPGAGGA